VNSTTIEEVAYFDGELTCECVAEPDCTCDYFAGTWTYFPYFDRFVDLSFCLFLVAVRLTCDSFVFIVANLISSRSGITIAGGIAEGLFILRPTL
jgi:hypothetical protein